MPHTLAVPSSDSMSIILRELGRDPYLKSKHSVRSYSSDLAGFERWRQGRPITKLLVEEYASLLNATEHAPSSINRKLAAIRWWARRLSDLAAEDPSLSQDQRELVSAQTARVIAIKGVRGERPLRGRQLAFRELAALLEACHIDDTPAGRRDAALIALGWASGARRFELANLTLADLAFTDAQSAEIVLRGKGNKTRIVYVQQGAVNALQDWLSLRGTAAGPLFCPIRKGKKIAPRCRLSTEALARLLERRRQAAGVDPLTWHDFRRTLASDLLDADVDLVTIQKILGHASPVTTGKYDRRDETAKRKAAKLVKVPYVRRNGSQ